MPGLSGTLNMQVSQAMPTSTDARDAQVNTDARTWELRGGLEATSRLGDGRGAGWAGAGACAACRGGAVGAGGGSCGSARSPNNAKPSSSDVEGFAELCAAR